MRISDWSSDVCSSDLDDAATRLIAYQHLEWPCDHVPGADAARVPRAGDADAAVAASCHPLLGRTTNADEDHRPVWHNPPDHPGRNAFRGTRRRSEEHTSELQSLMRISYAVF